MPKLRCLEEPWMKPDPKEQTRLAFQQMFADVFPQTTAVALAVCIDQHCESLIAEWMNTGKKWWNVDTFLRDIFITVTVFMMTKRFNLDERNAARIASQALNEKPLEGAIFTPLQVEQIVKAHADLMRALANTATKEGAPGC